MVAVTIARQLIDRGTVSQVVVVVPTDALRLQWADAGGPLRLRPYDGDTVIRKDGYDGIVVTYAQLGTGVTADLIRTASGREAFLGIFDEIHHAGESRAWSRGLSRAFEHAVRRLALTGTPWRSDNNPIPFVHYKDSMVAPDYNYRYGKAVTDGVCRPIVFEAYNGEARWVDCGRIIETQVDADLDDEMTGAALDTLYRPEQTWIPALLKTANEALAEIRADVPDAGGLVIADRKWQAEAYAAILQRITGAAPTLVISEGTDNADAKEKLDAFRKSRSPWLVAVRMVSEGIDIPRLSVGVYAAKTTTPLFFRQVVGRFVRIRPDETHNAQLFIPSVPVFVRHAMEIERELLHELAEQEAQETKRRKEMEERQQTFDLRFPLSTSEPVFDRSIHRGEEYEELDLNRGRTFCDKYGLPANFAVNVARGLREEQLTVVGVDVTVAPVSDPEPQHRLETRLRQEVEKLTRRLDHAEGRDKGATNYELRRAGWPARKGCSVEQLQAVRDYLLDRLSG
jgi:superfamily II DNA or RNA helicase